MTGLLTLLGIAAAVVIVGGTAAIMWMLARPPRLTPGRAMAMDLPGEPSDVGLSGASIELTLPGGVRTPAFVIEGRNPAGPTVLMYHGLLESRQASLPRAAVLADFACRLILPDLRAHGEASRSLCHGGTLEIEDALATLEQMDGEGPLVLHGFSLGAGVVLGTAAVLGDAERSPRAQAAAERWRLVGVVAEGVYRKWYPPLSRLLWHHRIPPVPFVPLLRLLHEPLRADLRRYDRAEDAKRLDVPLLMIHGEHDWLCDPQNAKAVADAASDATFVTIPGAKHMDVATRDPDRYRAALAAFFQALPESQTARPMSLAAPEPTA
ncbi:MAG: alpha/beta hydrolase [Phycisphaeraceae bacterium]